MPLYRANNRLVLFMHIPKTGGTSVEEALVAHGAVQALKSPRGEGIPRREKLSRIALQHLSHAQLRSVLPDGLYDYAFTVVRNPYARIVSSYRWDTRKRSRPPSFDRWFLLRAWKHAHRTYYADNHMRPQVDFLGPEVEVFRLEAGLEPAVRKACEELNLTWDAQHVAHEKRMGAPEPVAIRSHTLKRVQRLFAEDFSRLGYDLAVPEGLFDISEGRHPISLLVG